MEGTWLRPGFIRRPSDAFPTSQPPGSAFQTNPLPYAQVGRPGPSLF